MPRLGIPRPNRVLATRLEPSIHNKMDNALLAPHPGDLLLITDNLQAQADFLITKAIALAIKPPKNSVHRDCIFVSTAKSFDYWKTILTKTVWVTLFQDPFQRPIYHRVRIRPQPSTPASSPSSTLSRSLTLKGSPPQ
jgi:hypothetical protein